MNILDTIHEQVSPELVSQLSQRVGEHPEATKSALENSLQALVGSAVAKASSPEGATSLFSLLKEKVRQDGSPGSTTGLLTSITGANPSVDSSLITSLLGSKMGALQEFIANRSGVRSASVPSLMGVVGNLLMTFLGGQVATQGLGASGLGQFLRSQIPHLQGVLSPALAGVLGIGNLLSPSKVSSLAPERTPDVPIGEPLRQSVPQGISSGSRVLRFALLPLLLLFGVLFLALRHHPKPSVGGASDESLTIRGGGTAATSYDPDLANASSLTDRLKTVFAHGAGHPIELDGVKFDSSGGLSSSSSPSLAALVRFIKENPGVKATIDSYGQTPEEAASRAGTITSAIARLGAAEDRIEVRPEVGESIPKVTFTK